MTHEMANRIIYSEGACPVEGCDFCFGGCSTRLSAVSLAKQWLTAHPETPAKPAPDPRRYEIARAVMAAIVTCPDSCTLNPIDVSKAAVKWADALIKELDKIGEVIPDKIKRELVVYTDEFDTINTP